jgi:hypothetical protein
MRALMFQRVIQMKIFLNQNKLCRPLSLWFFCTDSYSMIPVIHISINRTKDNMHATACTPTINPSPASGWHCPRPRPCPRPCTCFHAHNQPLARIRATQPCFIRANFAECIIVQHSKSGLFEIRFSFFWFWANAIIHMCVWRWKNL